MGDEGGGGFDKTPTCLTFPSFLEESGKVLYLLRIVCMRFVVEDAGQK